MKMLPGDKMFSSQLPSAGSLPSYLSCRSSSTRISYCCSSSIFLCNAFETNLIQFYRVNKIGLEKKCPCTIPVEIVNLLFIFFCGWWRHSLNWQGWLSLHWKEYMFINPCHSYNQNFYLKNTLRSPEPVGDVARIHCNDYPGLRLRPHLDDDRARARSSNRRNCQVYQNHSQLKTCPSLSIHLTSQMFLFVLNNRFIQVPWKGNGKDSWDHHLLRSLLGSIFPLFLFFSCPLTIRVFTTL